MRLALFTLALAGVTVAAARAADKAADDLAKLKGTWKVMGVGTYVVNPDSLKPFRKDRKTANTVQFEGDKVKFLLDGAALSEFTVKLDPSQSPAAIDFVGDGKTYPGIYELKDDTVRLCILEGKDRPTDITGNKHAFGQVGMIAFTLKRSK